MCLVNAIYDFIQRVRTASFARKTIANLQNDDLRTDTREIFAIFFANSPSYGRPFRRLGSRAPTTELKLLWFHVHNV